MGKLFLTEHKFTKVKSNPLVRARHGYANATDDSFSFQIVFPENWKNSLPRSVFDPVSFAYDLMENVDIFVDIDGVSLEMDGKTLHNLYCRLDIIRNAMIEASNV